MKRLILIYLAFILLISCSKGPRPILYGEDMCHFCSMTVVDHQHASQLITKKGRVYQFDSVECLVNYTHTDEVALDQVANFYVNHYNTPKELIDATSASYIITDKIPSPMAANITALSTLEEAQKIKKEFGGEILTWNDLIIREFKHNYNKN